MRDQVGRSRAQKLYPKLGLCQRCKVKQAFDRHHKDGDTFNNEPENISFLCRACHMIEDGRREKASLLLRHKPLRPFKPCQNCSKLYRPLRKGLCNRCYFYQQTHGTSRPATLLSLHTFRAKPKTFKLPGMTGKKHSEETKKHLSEIRKGKRLPQEVYDRAAASNRGQKRTPEQKTRISLGKIIEWAKRKAKTKQGEN